MFLNDMPKKITLSAKQCLLYGTCFFFSMHLQKKKQFYTHPLLGDYPYRDKDE